MFTPSSVNASACIVNAAALPLDGVNILALIHLLSLLFTDVSGRRKGELFAADLKNALDDVEYVANYFRDQQEGDEVR